MSGLYLPTIFFTVVLGYLIKLRQLLPLAVRDSSKVASPKLYDSCSLQAFLSTNVGLYAQQSALRREVSPLALSRVLVWRRAARNRFASYFGLTVRVTPNNVFMVVYDLRGRVVFWLSRGTRNEDFLKYGRVSVNLVRVMLARFCALMHEAEIGNMVYCLTVRGKVSLSVVWQYLYQQQFFVRRMRRTVGLPHNGCRLPARRRGAKN